MESYLEKRTEAELRDRMAMLHALHATHLAVSSADSIEGVARAGLSRIHDVVAYARACLIYEDVQTPGALLAVEAENGTVKDGQQRLHWEEIAIWKELSEGRIYAESERSAAYARLHSVLRWDSMHSYLTVPLLFQEEWIGSLNLGAEKPNSFIPEHLLFVEEIANSIVATIRQMRLFEQIRAGRQQLKLLSQRLLVAQEDERRRIARELHDEIGQALTMIKIHLQRLQQKSEGPGYDPAEDLDMIDHAIQKVRNLSLDLHPSILDDLGLVPALRWLAARIASQSQLAVAFNSCAADARFPDSLESACFRIVQEALTNIVRHARARFVDINIERHGPVLEVSVRDDGAGFDVTAAWARAHEGSSLGLLGMQERSQFLGGQLDIDSQPGRGTEIRVRLPLDPAVRLERRKKRRQTP